MKFRALIASVLLAHASLAFPQGLPDLGDVSSTSLSDQQEKTIGDRIMRDVRSDADYIDDPEIADYINSIGSRLLGAADGPHPNIDFFVVRDDTINAFALPGGHIGVHSALILLTQNESELAGVLGHEIAHILQHHQARMLYGQRGVQFTSLAALALAILASRGGSQGGQVTEAAVASAGALQLQNQLDYTREHEREADRVGLQLLERAGFSPRAMVTFFERLLRANRLNELKGAPAYLRTHPLTTERIADMQDRVENMPPRLVADTFEYRVARAKLRVMMAGSPTEAVSLFQTMLADKTIVRPREDVYGLALAQRRARDFEGAWKTLEPLREGGHSHPAFELLAGELQSDMGHPAKALEIYRAVLQMHPDYRALVYAHLDLLQQMGRTKEVLADVEKRLRAMPADARLYEIQARAYEAAGNYAAQHRAQGEAQYRRGNLGAAVDQLELAVKTKNGNFYDLSSAEARLREMRTLLENQRAAEKALKIS
ncbi:MAG TPA: M48 family metalloprotease [Usitatibacter sp.]|nr:M48 family metalloprotease [Usitatibacter sp.]